MARTLYQILGVSRDASTVEVEAAFRERMAEFKERTYAGTHSQDDVREAYRVLSNVNVRTDYDETLPRLKQAHDAQSEGGFPTWIKFALPFVLVVAIFSWMKLRAPREPVITVKSVTRVEAQKVSNDEPVDTAPAPAPAPITVAAAPMGAPGTAEDVFATASPSIARVRAVDATGQKVSQGSGVVISPGVIITNCHVTTDSADITVKVGNGEYRAAVTLADEELDLCRLSVGGLDAPSVTVSTVKSLRTGQRVFAIGAPQGLELTISEGIVSSLREFPQGTVIQTTAAISPGSSGGGLFDAGGRLVGVVTFQHRFGQNLNFALPADWINEMQARTK